MTNLKEKNSLEITREKLVQLYVTETKSLDEIASSFGFKSRTPITNAMLKYNIPTRTKKESAKIVSEKNSTFFISKEQLDHDVKNFSILQLVKRYNVPRSRIYKLMEEYGIENNYYKNLEIKEKIKLESDELSPKEIALKYDIDVTLVKRFKKNYNKRVYSIKEIKERILLYNYDISNKGFPKQLFYDDENLYTSILHHTKNHKLKTNKITERLYRILNDLPEHHVEMCSNCNKNELIFLTFEVGYGNSDYKLCGNCNNVLNGVSKLSQKLFWEIYNNLNNTKECFFHELNYEVTLNMEKEFKAIHEKANKRWYKLDFLCDNKVIEFDGTFYHKDKEKDEVADMFFKHKGYEILRIPEEEYNKFPQETITKCLQFLNQ